MPPFDDDPSKPTRPCGRCGGNAFYWRQGIVPGDPAAPRGSRRGEAHYQPAWQCLNCGYLEPHERRIRASRGAATERSGM